MKYPLSSTFGLGFMPFAPGTWGSLFTVVIFMSLGYFVPEWANIAVMSGLVILFSWACVKYGSAVINDAGKSDPGWVVADETAGQAVTFLIMLLIGFENVCIASAVGFALFRLFDIVKPWPVSRLEKLPEGKGILADDIGAGLLAGIAWAVLYYSGAAGWLDGCATDAGKGLTMQWAALLGAVQGLTEFLPVSSSGHLVMMEDFLPDIEPDSSEMLLFDLSIHIGTVFAIFAVYFCDIVNFGKNLLRAPQYGKGPVEIYKKCPSVHVAVVAFVVTVVTFVLYKLFEDPLESARKLPVVAVMWFVTGTLLLITDLRVRARKGLRDFGIFSAVILGAAQSAAILPGISRSGATICVAILLGLHRKWAVELSFFIGIPAILGGAAIKFMQEFDKISSQSLPVGVILTGMAVSFVFGAVSLKLLIAGSRKRKLKYFAFYLYILAGIVAVYLLLR